MQNKNLKSFLSLTLCIVLIAAIALFTSGCANDQTDTGNSQSVSASNSTNATVYGKGNTSFNFTVTDTTGAQSDFIINTDKTTVGEALLEVGLIAGEESQYGLYVKTVNGITLDFDKDGKYWAFYVDGNYASAGVDSTEIVANSTYSFKAE